MDKSRRKELLQTYKEQKATPGIVAVRCTATGQSWTLASPNVEQQQKGLWFQFRMGTFPGNSVQSAWNAHGADAFVFEVLEAIKDDNALLVPVLLKERELHWRKVLGAETLV
jgi:hypothetical protein